MATRRISEASASVPCWSFLILEEIDQTGQDSRGLQGVGQVGVHGTTYKSWGVLGSSHHDGDQSTGVVGLGLALNNTGVLAQAHKGTSAYAIWAKSREGYAGVFDGKVLVGGF